MWGAGLRIESAWFGVNGLGFRDYGVGCRVQHRFYVEGWGSRAAPANVWGVVVEGA